jgi:hypothetical protein
MKKILFTVCFFLSINVYSVPRVPGFSVVRAGPTTTYKVYPNGPYKAPSAAPGEMGLIPLDSNYSVANAVGAGKYVTGINIPIGETIAAVRVDSLISGASLAAAAAGLIGKLGPLGLAITAGTALYDYLQNADIDYNNSTGIATDHNATSLPAPQQTALDDCNAWVASNLGSGDGVRCFLDNTEYRAQHNSFGSWINDFQFPFNNNGEVGEPSMTPLTSNQIKDKLTASPPSNFAPIVKAIHDLDFESDPLQDDTSFDITLDPASATKTSAPVETVTDHGDKQVSQTTTTATKTGPDTFEASNTTTTTTTHPDGTTTTTTTTNAPAAPAPASEVSLDLSPVVDAVNIAKNQAHQDAQAIPGETAKHILDDAPTSPPPNPPYDTDTDLYFPFLEGPNPFVWSPLAWVPTLPEPNCNYEIHREIFGFSFDFAPCEPLAPLRTVLAWVFAVLTGWTVFIIIFRSTATN